MSKLKNDLLNGIDEIRSVLSGLDDCLANLVLAEDQLQEELKRIPRFERSLVPFREVWNRIRRVSAERNFGFASRATPRFN